MNKRLKIILISFLSAALMLCGWTAYAATSSSATTSTTLKGKLTTLTSDTITLHTETGDQSVPLASSVWVYLNDQKAQLGDLRTGNEIELILNNKKQAAYVKASSEPAAVSEPAPSQTPVPSVTPANAAASSSTAQPTSTPTKLKDSTPAPTPSASHEDVEDMDVSVDGQHFNLHVKQANGPHGPEFDLSIQSPHAGRIHLTGAQAEAWISKLLGSVDLNAPSARLVLGQQLAKQYDLDANKLNVHVKVNSKEKEDEHENEKKQEIEREKGKDQGKEKDNRDKNEKKQENGKKHD